MNFDQYKGKSVTIKSTGAQGTIVAVRLKKGSGGGMSARMIVIDIEGKEHELMPHELIIL